MTRRPNILWLNTDHQLFANRPAAAQRLPLQAWLAERGMVFDRAYTVLPVCTPARASMLTGLYPHNHGLTENEGRFGGREGLDATDRLFTAALGDAGYRCGWFGKWHLSNSLGADAFGFEGYGPRGYGYPFRSGEYRDYLDRWELPDPVVQIELSGESGTPPGTRINLVEQSDWFDYEAGSAILETPVETHEAYFVADLAQGWMRDTGDAPFFLRVDTWGPHPPYVVAAPFDAAFGDLATAASQNLHADLARRPRHHADYRDYWHNLLDNAARDYALLSRRALQQAALCETALMRLLHDLEETGRADDTVVVFSADHGDAVASNGGVMNKGGLMVEETLRIPLAIAGKGIAAGRDDTLVANIDIAPTLLDLCGIAGPRMDGESLVTLLRGEGPLARDGLMTEHYGLAQPLWQRAFHRDRWKLVIQEDGFTELYDLSADPSEMVNLAGSTPHTGILAGMRKGLLDALDAHGDRSVPAERLRSKAARA